VNVFVTGGTGVLGRAVLPKLKAAGHHAVAPAARALDLFDPGAVGDALAAAEPEAIMHLATRIPPTDRMGEPEAWAENDRLRAEASRLLVDAAIEAGVRVYVVPTITFVYPPGPADEDTPIGDQPFFLESALVAEAEAARFAGAGRTGVVLRLGLLYGPWTGSDEPNPMFGATLEIHDAGEALLAALELPSGIYNVVDDGSPVSAERFKAATGWRPRGGS
jgi:nucleoside-diphosphate-sugar epimerase